VQIEMHDQSRVRLSSRQRNFVTVGSSFDQANISRQGLSGNDDGR